jgi:hypothetical protein
VPAVFFLLLIISIQLGKRTMSELRGTLCIYTFLVCLFVIYQPKAVIGEDGIPVPLGLGPGKTLFHIQTVMIFFALLSAIIRSWIRSKFM